MDDLQPTDVADAAAKTDDRRERFEADLAQVQVRSGSAANEPKLAAAGLVLMVIGTIVALIAFVTSGTQADTRDVLSSVILALVGVCVVVAGAVVFLRYSLGRFLRAWLLRLIYEQQSSRP